ncbi:MAG: hypothetical protein WCT46_01975 [Candidatus Gracilibacteria bacterium]|jgi:hypothetical protein
MVIKDFHDAMCKAVLDELPIDTNETRNYIMDLLGMNELDIEQLSPVKKTWWPLADKRDVKYPDDVKKQWKHDVKQAALRVVKEGIPIGKMKFREGDKMKKAVVAYLGSLVKKKK